MHFKEVQTTRDKLLRSLRWQPRATSFLPTSVPSFVSSRLGHPRYHKVRARTLGKTQHLEASRSIFSSQCMQNRHQARRPTQNLYFFRRQHAVSLDTNRFGGAERDRTADPLLAKQVLSQLSYSPISSIAPIFIEVRQLPRHRSFPAAPCVAKRRSMVGPGRLELPTPRLSSVCSNQLSYGPILVKPVQTAINHPDRRGSLSS